MWTDLPLFPEDASTVASRVDGLYFYLVAVAAFFTLLIVALLVSFGIKYRRRPGNEVAVRVPTSLKLEAAWIAVPLVLTLVMFAWGSSLFVEMRQVPEGALEIHVVGRQWMWKVQHPGGQREINELHVPAGRPIRLTLASQDVIHSFYVPAFRIKQDVIPGRSTSAWFQATKPGRYHLFCAEYCGTLHSGMRGTVTVLEPWQYEQWLAGGFTEGSLASTGERLFQSLGCATCHTGGPGARGPRLEGLLGATVTLADGRTVTADAAYLRESILRPAAKVVAGFAPLMPSFEGQVSEETLIALIEYLKSLKAPEGRR